MRFAVATPLIKTKEAIMCAIVRRIVTAVTLLALMQAVAVAQSPSDKRAWGYVFGGAGGNSGGNSTASFQVGAGGEGLVYKGLGLGAEIGYLAPFRAGGDGFGIFSADGSYHFQHSKSKLVPFVTGGYSVAFRSGTSSSGGNFGGGVQYWMKDHLGLRFEFRDHVFSSDSPHFYQFRVGLSF
jgi:outer membrane protein with beta-barrel domain